MEVSEVLLEKNIPYTEKGKDYIVRCLNPEHDDGNPSMRVDRVSGIFHCFACGFKGSVFSFFGLQADIRNTRREQVKRKITEKRVDSVGLEMPPGAVPYGGSWRNIKTETYEKFEAFECAEKDFISRIVFPIRDSTGNIRAFHGRHTSGGQPKYYTTPGAKLPLFPALIKPLKGHIILTEGIFDVLNLHDKGLDNSVCCFGTQNVDEYKLATLKLLGAHTLDIIFDGDKAGIEATQRVKALCEKIGLGNRVIKLKEQDPGDLTEAQVLGLRKKLYTSQ